MIVGHNYDCFVNSTSSNTMLDPTITNNNNTKTANTKSSSLLSSSLSLLLLNQQQSDTKIIKSDNILLYQYHYDDIINPERRYRRRHYRRKIQQVISLTNIPTISPMISISSSSQQPTTDLPTYMEETIPTISPQPTGISTRIINEFNITITTQPTISQQTSSTFAPTISAVPTYTDKCYVCDNNSSLYVNNYTHVVQIIPEVTATCGELDRAGRSGLIPPDISCELATNAVTNAIECQCGPLILSSSPILSPSISTTSPNNNDIIVSSDIPTPTITTIGSIINEPSDVPSDVSSTIVVTSTTPTSTPTGSGSDAMTSWTTTTTPTTITTTITTSTSTLSNNTNNMTIIPSTKRPTETSLPFDQPTSSPKSSSSSAMPISSSLHHLLHLLISSFVIMIMIVVPIII